MTHALFLLTYSVDLQVLNGLVVLLVFLCLNLDVPVIKRMAGMKDGGFRIWKMIIRRAVNGQEYPLGHI